MRDCASRAGFGHIFIARDKSGRFRHCDEGAAGYVAKYLTKNSKLSGVRTWACIGDYEGTKTRDIEFQGASVQVFRAAYREAIAAGSPRQLAFSLAKVAQRKFDHEESGVYASAGEGYKIKGTNADDTGRVFVADDRGEVPY